MKTPNNKPPPYEGVSSVRLAFEKAGVKPKGSIGTWHKRGWMPPSRRKK